MSLFSMLRDRDRSQNNDRSRKQRRGRTRDSLSRLAHTQAPAIVELLEDRLLLSTATKFAVFGFPTPTTAGTPGSVAVIPEDSSGNVVLSYRGTVILTSSDRNATLPSPHTFIAGDNGVATFSGVNLQTAGSQTVTATDTVFGTISGSETGITVKPAAADHLVVSSLPAATPTGKPVSVTVTAEDVLRNTDTNYLGTVHFTSSSGVTADVLPADYTFVAGDKGVHTFTGVTLNTAGTNKTITATDTTTNSINGSASVQVGAPATNLSITAPPTANTGAPFDVTVTAQSGNGLATAFGYTGTVHFISSDAAAGLPADYTFTPADAGSHIFKGVTLKTTGSKTVIATDTLNPTITGSAPVTVAAPAPATQLAITAPANAAAGGPFSIIVTALDASNTTATGYTGTVNFASSGAAAGGLPADYTFTTGVGGDNGVHTFTNGVTLKTIGSSPVIATDNVTPTITGTAPVTVAAPAPATHLAITAPANAAAGGPFSVTVTAQSGLPADTITAPNYLGTVHFTSDDAAAGLPADYTFVAGDRGVHTFTGVTLKTVGATKTVTATDTTTPTITGTTPLVQVGAPAQPAVPLQRELLPR